MKKLSLSPAIALTAAIALVWSSAAIAADPTVACVCTVMSTKPDGSPSTDLGAVGYQPFGPTYPNATDPLHKSACRSACMQKTSGIATNSTSKAEYQTRACSSSSSKYQNMKLKVFAILGPNSPDPAKDLAIMNYTPKTTATSCNCPSGWTKGNVAGTSVQCSKEVSGAFTVAAPANGTTIGTWGFVKDGKAHAWGNSSNGGAGACTQTVTQAEACGLSW